MVDQALLVSHSLIRTTTLIVNHSDFIRSDYMIYNRGSSEDWDRYASISEDQGWSWDAVQQYFRKACHLICLHNHAGVDGCWNRTKNGLNLQIIIILLDNSIPPFTVPLELMELASLASLKCLLIQGSFKLPKTLQMSSHST